MWTYLAATHVLEILKARHAAIPEIIANLKERAESFGGYTGLDGIAAGADGQEALSTTAPATVDSMEPVHHHHAARVEPTSPKAIPEGLSASLPLLSFWLVLLPKSRMMRMMTPARAAHECIPIRIPQPGDRPLTPVSPQAVGPRHWPKGPRMSRPSGLKCALHLARLILAMYLKFVRCLEVSPILSISFPPPPSLTRCHTHFLRTRAPSCHLGIGGHV